MLIKKFQRTEQQHHANAGDPTGAHGYHYTTTTQHYLVFRCENSEEKKYSVDGTEYRKWKEGVSGKLMFQGSRYLGFVDDQNK